MEDTFAEIEGEGALVVSLLEVVGCDFECARGHYFTVDCSVGDFIFLTIAPVVGVWDVGGNFFYVLFLGQIGIGLGGEEVYANGIGDVTTTLGAE